MKKTSPMQAKVVPALLLLASNAHAADSTALPAWLAGCWAQEQAERGSMEMWMTPAGESMLGMSRTVRDGKTVAHEFMQILVRNDALVFVARPSNQREATFTAARNLEREIVFENLEHDFPQRIIYRTSAPGTLSARIEGMREGRLRGIDFAFEKVPCD